MVRSLFIGKLSKKESGVQMRTSRLLRYQMMNVRSSNSESAFFRRATAFAFTVCLHRFEVTRKRGMTEIEIALGGDGVAKPLDYSGKQHPLAV